MIYFIRLAALVALLSSHVAGVATSGSGVTTRYWYIPQSTITVRP